MGCNTCIALTGDCLVFESQAITPDTSAYAGGDEVGAKITFDGVSEGTKSGYIIGIEIVEKATTLQKPSFDLFIANVDYTAAGDNSAFIMPIEVTSSNIVRRYTVNSWTDIDSASATKYSHNVVDGLAIPFTSDRAGALYGSLIIGSAKTYPSSSELTVKIIVKVNNS